MPPQITPEPHPAAAHNPLLAAGSDGQWHWNTVLPRRLSLTSAPTFQAADLGIISREAVPTALEQAFHHRIPFRLVQTRSRRGHDGAWGSPGCAPSLTGWHRRCTSASSFSSCTPASGSCLAGRLARSPRKSSANADVAPCGIAWAFLGILIHLKGDWPGLRHAVLIEPLIACGGGGAPTGVVVMGELVKAVEGESSIWVTFSPRSWKVGHREDVLAQAELLDTPWYCDYQQPQPPLATRAVFSFTGFPGDPERHVYLHHDGYPTEPPGAFAVACVEASLDASGFLVASCRSQQQAGTPGQPRAAPPMPSIATGAVPPHVSPT